MGDIFLKKVLLFLTVLSIFCCSVSVGASEVTVYGEGEYDNEKLVVNLFVDVPSSNEALLSFGVKVKYNPQELSTDMGNIEHNNLVWFLGMSGAGIPTPNNLIDLSTEGEVAVFGSKVDKENPCAGVSGDKILLTTITFDRIGNSVPAVTLSLGREDMHFANFVQIDGDNIDNSINLNGAISIVEEDSMVSVDLDGDGDVDKYDINKIIQNSGQPVEVCLPCDLNQDGIISISDAREMLLINTYNTTTSVLHINDLELNGSSFTIELNLNEQGIFVLTDLYENEEVTLLENISSKTTFDLETNFMHVSEIFIDGSSESYWLDLEVIEWEPITLQINNYGSNN